MRCDVVETDSERFSPMQIAQSTSRVLDPMEVAPWRDVSGNQSDGAASPDTHRNFSPNSSLNKGRSTSGGERVGFVESLLGGTPSPSASRPASNLALPKFNPMINTSDTKMSPSGESSPKHPDSPTNLFSRLKLFAKNGDGQSALNKSLQPRHAQFADDFEGGLGELTERLHSYSPSSSSSRLYTAMAGRTASYRPHLSKHHPSLSLGGGAAPYPDDDDASYNPFVVEAESGLSMSIPAGQSIGSHLASTPSVAGVSFNRRSLAAGLNPAGSSGMHAEGGLQGQTQAALQQLLKEGGRGRAEDGPPRLGRHSLGGVLKASGPPSFASPEFKGHRRVPSGGGDGKEDHFLKTDRTSPAHSSALRVSPGSGPSPQPSSVQHVSFKQVSRRSSGSDRLSAPGYDLSVEAGRRSQGQVQLDKTVDEDERF